MTITTMLMKTGYGTLRWQFIFSFFKMQITFSRVNYDPARYKVTRYNLKTQKIK